jgi:hypothetical protein
MNTQLHSSINCCCINILFISYIVIVYNTRVYIFFFWKTGKGTTTVPHIGTRGSISEETTNVWSLAFNSEENKTPLRKFPLIFEALSDLFHFLNFALYEIITSLFCTLPYSLSCFGSFASQSTLQPGLVAKEGRTLSAVNHVGNVKGHWEVLKMEWERDRATV